MISTFICRESEESLSILDYEASKTSVRYRAVINDDQLAVLHLQTVDIKDTPVSQLSLCPGVLESDILDLLSQSLNNTLDKLFIEKVEDEIVYRWEETEREEMKYERSKFYFFQE